VTGEGGVREIWRRTDRPASFEIDVSLGKPFDVTRLKGETSDTLRKWGEEYGAMARAAYGAPASLVRIADCPCCEASTEQAAPFASIYGAEYRRCLHCGHVFLLRQRSNDALNKSFEQTDDYAREYIDSAQIELRIQQIMAPKLKWVVEQYAKRYGRAPQSLLDVGAAGGHFVKVARNGDIRADGVELNTAAVAFAKRAFDLDLIRADFFTAVLPQQYDIVTFWGLLEYTPQPRTFVRRARDLLTPQAGMLIIEVPRADCVGSAVQQEFSETVWRHLEPCTHMNVYSDAGLATVLHDQGFDPVAAWYFGMDVFELLTQLSIALDDSAVIGKLKAVIAPLQKCLDMAELGDDLVLAAVPASGPGWN
jgi:2-polyprenyl-3-methyl-5-hydroxy-6-metoxy-1,4-benzoquinol methylase